MSSVSAIDSELFNSLQALVWPLLGAVDEEARNQVIKRWHSQPGFVFSEPVPFGFSQRDNGPCGLLAALNGLTLYHYLGGADSTPPMTPVAARRLALATALRQARPFPTAPVYVVTGDTSAESPSFWGLLDPNRFSLHTVSGEGRELDDLIDSVIDTRYEADGGLVLFVYSLTLTRGIDKVRSDINDPDGMVTLILDEWGFCSMGLTQFVLSGVAVDTTDPMAKLLDPVEGAEPVGPRPPSLVGLLTYMEADSLVYGGIGYIVADHFKHPVAPIWVLHGRDHYTLVFSSDAKTAGEVERLPSFTLTHYNGLPPSGPAASTMSVTNPLYMAGAELGSDMANTGTEPLAGGLQRYNVTMILRRSEDPSGAFKYEVAISHEPGEGGSGSSTGAAAASTTSTTPAASATVASSSGDGLCIKGCGFHGSPKFGGMCSVCAKKYPSEVAPPQPAPSSSSSSSSSSPGGSGSSTDGPLCIDAVLPTLESEWRCRHCVIQMVYTTNPGTVDTCATCHQHISVARRTVWLTFNELSKVAQTEVDMRYTPPIVSALRTCFKGIQVTFSGKPPTI